MSEEKKMNMIEQAENESKEGKLPEAGADAVTGTDSVAKTGEKKERGVSLRGKSGAADPRQKKLKHYSALSLILVLVVVIIANLLADSLFGKSLRFDWTANRMLSLSEVSEDLLSKLDQKVELIPLAKEDQFPSASSLSFVKDLLQEYEKKSGGKIRIRYVDPELEPQIVKELDPDHVRNLRKGQLAVYNPENKKVKLLDPNSFVNAEMNQQTFQQQVTGYSAEEKISAAIQYVASAETPVVYFTQGHQEDDRNKNYTILRDLLQNNNYELKDLQGLNLEAIPDDAKLVIMLNPKVDLRESEVSIYTNYLKEGGALLVLADFSGEGFKELNKVLAEQNLKLGTDRVREDDQTRQLSGDPYSFVANEPSSFVNQEEVKNATLVSQARSLSSAMNDKEWIQVKPLLQSAESGMLEEGGDSKKLSKKGTQTLAMASENNGYRGGKDKHGKTIENATKTIVFGSSLFVSDQVLFSFMHQTHNLILLNNSLNWLLGNSRNHLAIRPVTPVSYAVRAESYPLVPWIAGFVVIVLPLFFLITAAAVYRRRKNL